MTEHLGDVKTTATMAIITGDPDRVPALASSLGPEPHTVTRQRGFVTSEVPDVHGSGLPMLVVSTGIGGPATAIVADELWHLGITQIVRVGTCGSMQRHVRPGDLVISSGTVRDDGTSRQYVPLEVPAVPDSQLFVGLAQAAREAGLRHHIGVTHCKDALSGERPFGMPLSPEWSARWNILRSIGVLATEMESAALFAAAMVRGIHCASLVVPVDSSLSKDDRLRALCDAARLAGTSMIGLATTGESAT
ncbi:MAG: nucleoside phosphorylase [Pseudonocardiaceae bacterium]